MICTFCGTENRTGNRFCGMCGVRLERRKAERRARESGSTKCPSCGFENEHGHRFCGMCGVRIERRAQDRRGTAVAEKARATAIAHAQLPTPEARMTSWQTEGDDDRVSVATIIATAPPPPPRTQSASPEPRNYVTSLGGPSFLGLNDSDSESEYLLDDEESPRSGLRTVLLLVILAVIGGLIFLQYRSNLRATPKSSTPPKAQPAAIPAEQTSTRKADNQKEIAAVVGANKLQSGVSGAVKASATDNTADDSADAKGKAAVTKSAAKSASDDSESDSSAVTRSQPSATLIKAQQYLHGRGVPQNCEQGMVYLKAATREDDPDAAVQMAALYASGFCVPQDRVKAYQWFASAQEMKPENRWIAKNLDQLWAQMTPTERRQIR